MNTEQIMDLVQRLRTKLARIYLSPERLIEAANAIEALVQERDALKAQLETANSGWYDKLLEATLERDALRAEAGDLTIQQRNSYQKGHNAGIAHHKEATQKLMIERDTYQVAADKLAAENKTLRDLLAEAANDVDYYSAYAGEYLCKKHDIAGTVATYRAALQGANHEPN